MIRALAAKQRADGACGQGHDAPERTCIVTRELHPPEHLIRFVHDPEGRVTPDLLRRLPGRGVWVTCHRQTLETAIKTKAFARAMRRRVEVDDDLADRVDALLLRRAVEQLSICNKAGLVLCGSGKVNSWLEAGANGVLVQAADASPDGLAKVARKYRAICAAKESRPIEVSLLTIDELSLAIGRANVVHAALSKGKAATNFLAAVSRVEKFRAAESEAPAFLVADKATIEQPNVIRKTGQV